jgi:hypothetical protein
MGAYLKGLGFVFAVQEQGWPEVEKLYTEYPPQSTEQILHPEKWRARESPHSIEWPSFVRVRQLKEWDLLDSDVIGEFQWRVIFNEQGLRNDAEAAAAGWDGDRYAVFKHKDSDATLLLLRTSWDSTAQAEEFAAAYRRLLVNKYADAPEPSRVVQKKEEVFIVEGGNEKDLDALVKVVRKAKKTKKRLPGCVTRERLVRRHEEALPSFRRSRVGGNPCCAVTRACERRWILAYARMTRPFVPLG